MGSDSAASSETSIEIRNDPKVFLNGDVLFGFADSFRAGQLLRHSLQIPKIPATTEELDKWLVTTFIDAVRSCLDAGGVSSKENGTEEGNMFLLGIMGRLYSVESDYQVARLIAGYAAIGCGADLALGALHATRSLKNARGRILRALEASAEHSAYVAPPFTILESRYG